jgi:hypothetical protein
VPTRSGLTWRAVDLHLKRGGRAWRVNWPREQYVEMVLDDRIRYVMTKGGSHEHWHPTLEDYIEPVWCVGS